MNQTAESTTQKNSPKSLAMLVSAMTIFGTIGIFRRMIPMPSALVAFIRGAVGSIFLILFVKCRGKKIRRGISRKTAGILILSGCLIGVNWMLLFEAYNYTTVSVATLCYYMEPTFVVILSTLLLKEKLTARKAICSVIALVGMVLVSGIVDGLVRLKTSSDASGVSAGNASRVASGVTSNASSVLPAGSLTGILMGLGAALIYAIVILLNKKIPSVDAYEKTILQLGFAAIIMMPYLLFTGEFTGNVWSLKTVLLLLLVGILHTGINYSLYFGSMDGLRTDTIALFSYIDPVVALILSALILHEEMSLLGIVGAVMILGSAVASEMKKG